MKNKLLVLFLLLLAGVNGVPAWAAPLFSDPAEATPLAGDPGEVVLRSRTVQLDINQLRLNDGTPVPVGTLLDLNFFPGETMTVRIDQVNSHLSGGITLVGSVVGQAQGQIIFAIHGNTVMANLRLPGLLCELRPLGDGNYGVYDLDPDGYPGDGLPLLPGLPDMANDTPPTQSDNGSLLDVLVVYTTSARQGAGGTSQMEALIDLAESQTNTGLADSGVTPRIRVVHRQEVAYSESGFSFSGALNDLRDGNVPDAHTLREQFGADLVAMIVEGDSSLCGIAFFMSTVSSAFASSAFSVTKRTCSTGNLTFGHEIGHNLGARHQREADSSDGPFTFNHGYADATNNFRTIMAIATGTCASCPRIAQWSNPDVQFSGNPTGIAEGNAEAADNRKTLNQTAATAAAFRDTVIPEGADFTPSASVVMPFWQTSVGAYTFVAVTHPSLSGMDPAIGISARAFLNGGGQYGAVKEFTVAAGETARLFIIPSNHATLTSTNFPELNFISGASQGIGYLRLDPVSTSPTTLTANNGYRDVTMLSMWGAVVIEGLFTGFALEFVGDMQDSASHAGMTLGRFPSGVN